MLFALCYCYYSKIELNFHCYRCIKWIRLINLKVELIVIVVIVIAIGIVVDNVVVVVVLVKFIVVIKEIKE